MRAKIAAFALVVGILGGCRGRDAPRQTPEQAPNPLLQPRRLEESSPEDFRARFETTQGSFEVEVHRPWAPKGADRFYNLVKNGYYDGDRVYRVIAGTIAQWGVNGDPRINAVWKEAYIVDDSVTHSNRRGRIAFAQGGVHTRTTVVFVNLRDNPSLDERYAPFGEVVQGMDVLDRFYSDYGDGPPRGDGPYQARAEALGESYFAQQFPKLDRITKAEILPE